MLYKAQIYCLFIITLLFFMCWLGKKNKSKEDQLYEVILIFAFANMCFDIASNYTMNHLNSVSLFVIRITYQIFFITLITIFLLVYKYLVTLIEKELGRKLREKKLSLIPYVIILFLNMMLPIYYKETDHGIYSYGPGAYMVFVCVVVFMFLTIELIIRYSKNISKKNKMAIILAFVCKFGSSLYQMYDPTALTSSLGVTLLCLCMFMTVANPDAVLVELLKEETTRADAANRAKSDFLAKMSHEIRTPMNGVLCMNEMILRESSEPEIKKYAYDIKSSASSLLGIINEILDSSKIESGMMEIHPDNYEICSLLNDLYNMISVRAKNKGLELIFDIDSTMPSQFFGDDIRIRQVLINLLSNAVKYTPNGTVTMTVTSRIEGENAILHFAVKDTGIGIKKENIAELFDKFYRFDQDKNRYIEGTGLGLNIAVQILKMMGSELKVESEYEIGSEFSFDIVQRIVNVEPLGDFRERILNVVKDYNYQLSYTAPHAKVLVVDDNEMNRKVFKNLLKQTQIQVYEAASGREALSMVEQQSFHIIFLDHMMPEMDGIDTLHLIREEKLCMDTPVIMLTANAVKGAKELYFKKGFDDFLTKPIIPDILDQMILNYLPDELVSEGNHVKEIQQSRNMEHLTELEEFDFDYAMNILTREEILHKILVDFYCTLESIPQKLSAMLDSISQEETMNTYRIEVHALKSTSATVGALLLSKIARLLEIAALNYDVDRIHVLHPILLEEITKHRERIGSILPTTEDKVPIVNLEEMVAYFDMLKNSLENEDYSTADFISKEIQKYLFSPKVQNHVTTIIKQVRNLNTDDAIKTIDKVKDVIGVKI